MKPKDLAPLIFEASTMKKWNVNQVLHNNEWIKKIKMDVVLTLAHIHEYIRLWSFFSMCTLLRIPRTLSFRTSRLVGSILQPRPTIHNVLEKL
jgi:hypothetical protein